MKGHICKCDKVVQEVLSLSKSSGHIFGKSFPHQGVLSSRAPSLCLLPSGDPCPSYGSKRNLKVSFLLGIAPPPLRFHT